MNYVLAIVIAVILSAWIFFVIRAWVRYIDWIAENWPADFARLTSTRFPLVLLALIPVPLLFAWGMLGGFVGSTFLLVSLPLCLAPGLGMWLKNLPRIQAIRFASQQRFNN